VTISTPLAIVTVVAVLVLGVIALLRAPPGDIKTIIEFLTRWFPK
jgi:hypothetical protein